MLFGSPGSWAVGTGGRWVGLQASPATPPPPPPVQQTVACAAAGLLLRAKRGDLGVGARTAVRARPVPFTSDRRVVVLVFLGWEIRNTPRPVAPSVVLNNKLPSAVDKLAKSSGRIELGLGGSSPRSAERAWAWAWRCERAAHDEIDRTREHGQPAKPSEGVAASMRATAMTRATTWHMSTSIAIM